MSELPTCTVCEKPITFYMHQRYRKGGGVAYYHPDCCPEERCVERQRERKV